MLGCWLGSVYASYASLYYGGYSGSADGQRRGRPFPFILPGPRWIFRLRLHFLRAFLQQGVVHRCDPGQLPLVLYFLLQAVSV